MYVEGLSLKDDYTFLQQLQVCYIFYSTFMLLITISDLCTCVILNDIVISYYYLFIVLMLVTDNIYLSYTLCHICVCHGFM